MTTAPVLTPQEFRIASVIAMGGLLAVLDTTIVAVAMPRFMSAFAIDLAAAQWIVVAYALGLVTAMSLSAAVAERFGARYVYIAALFTFGVATAAAGFAPGFGALVAARVVQGVAGGFINPVGMALGFGLVEPARRARMTAITGLPLLLGPIIGPILGGLVLQGNSWRMLFWITLPPTFLAVFWSVRWIPQTPPARIRRRLDVPGVVQLVVGVVGVTLGLGADTLGLPIRVMAVAGGSVVATAFLVRSWHHPTPVLNVRLLRDAVFGRSAAVLATYAAPYFGSMLLMPTYVQTFRGDSALTSAFVMAPGAVGMGISIQIAARLLERIGPRVVVGGGISIAIGQTLVLTGVLGDDTAYVVLGALAFVQGLGTGAIMMPTMVSATRNLMGTDLVSGSAILPIVSTLANAIGTAAIGALCTGLIGALDGDGVLALRLTYVVTLGSMACALTIRLRTGRAGRVEEASPA